MFSVLSMLSKLPPCRGVLEGGNRLAKIKEGRSNRLRIPGLQQAVEFPQVLASPYNYSEGQFILTKKVGSGGGDPLFRRP